MPLSSSEVSERIKETTVQRLRKNGRLSSNRSHKKVYAQQAAVQEAIRKCCKTVSKQNKRYYQSKLFFEACLFVKESLMYVLLTVVNFDERGCKNPVAAF